MEDIKPVPFKRILDPDEFSDGDIIKCIRGTITKLYKIRSGSGTRGSYEYQDGEIKDEAGTIMGITFASCSQPDSAKGKRLTIQSVMTENFGKQGVKLEVSTYEKNGEEKTVKKLRITSAANISYDGERSQSPSQSSAQQSTNGRPMPQLHPKQVLQDMMDLHSVITALVNEKYKDFPDEFKRASISTLFIEAAHQGLVLDFTKRFNKNEIPPAPNDASKWGECVVPSGSNLGKRLSEIDNESLMKLYSYLTDQDAKTNFAKCVYRAAEDRNLIPDHTWEGDKEQETVHDDIPF